MQQAIKIPEREIGQGGQPQTSPYTINLTTPQRKTEKSFDIVSPIREKSETRILPQETKKTFGKGELIRMALIAITVVLLLNSLQIYSRVRETKDAVMDAAYAGYESMLGASPTGMDESAKAFEMAGDLIWYLTDNTEIANSNKYIKTAENLLSAGTAISSAGELFTKFADDVQEVSGNVLTENTGRKSSLTETLKTSFDTYLIPAFNELKTAQFYLDSANLDILPDEYSDKIELAKEYLSELNMFFEEISQNFPTIMALLGDEYPQKYMILLENNSELRPGGGFIGSFILMDVNDGYIESMTFHDIYEFDGSFNEYIAPPVDEIAYLTCCWGLRDANYSPDYAISSEKVAWFLEKEGGPTVDHVLMMDLSLVKDLIDAVGPIEIESLGAELTGENFELILSYIVESKLMGIENPKSILEEIIPEVKSSALDPENIDDVISILLESAQSKHFAAYSKNEDMQNFWRTLNLDGELYLPGAEDDYLLVTESGIGGNKTDSFIDQAIKHQTLISREGTLMDKLTITREHTFDSEVETWQYETLSALGFTEITDAVKSILGQGDNVAGMRVYVPKGTTLDSYDGDIEGEVTTTYDEDLDLNYFYFIIRTKPGETTNVELTYTLPFTLNMDPADDYFLYVEKQPGMDNTTFKKEIIAPNLNADAFYPEGEFTEGEDLIYKYETSLDSPLHLGGVFSR
ncbi:MAG: hypothetical protein UV80_C0005G0081 [Candidatus Peregrinibacteria bacterium GW2011_GWF2_43_17]|nr:MAG: hypothetical protein UV80_C0005G0081 [Candidatus Peregrinibacteria bacterium GW2011_GWF2_43_17]